MYFFKLRYVKNQFDSPKNDFLIKILNYLYNVHQRSVLKHFFKKCALIDEAYSYWLFLNGNYLAKYCALCSSYKFSHAIFYL